MSRITVNSKCRLCRTEGAKLYLKGTRCLSSKCPLERKGVVPPGMHGLKRAKKPTDYGIQLRAKQKAKRIYGVQETQFKNYFLKAKNLKGQIGENLLILLEKRLDNIVYVAGLAASRSQAKQLISHRHIFVNGKPLNICSYSSKIGDLITLDKSAADTLDTQLKLTDKDFKSPDWLELDKSTVSVEVVSEPDPTATGNDIDINLIIEYYSR